MNTPRRTCSVEDAIGLLAGKWKLFIVRVLALEGPLGFNKLSRALGDISNKVLTENLRALEADAVVTVMSVEPGRYEYLLTQSGRQLMPILKGLGDWADAHRASEDMSLGSLTRPTRDR